VWVSEHHGAGDGHLSACLVALAACAGASERLMLGTGVLLAPFHEPRQLAREALTLQDLSGGRLLLGLGMGWREEEFRLFGVPRARRLRLTMAAVEELRRHPGAPPIYLGGLAEPAVRRAGELGDGYVRSLVGVAIATGLEAGREAVGWLEAGACAAGRDPKALPVALFQNCFVGDWREARAGVLHQLGAYRGWHAGSDVPGRPLGVLPPPEAEARAQTPSGPPDAVARALRPLVDTFGAGRDLHLVVRLHYPGMRFETAARAVRRFGAEVIPRLR
jgi:alkanesulfonate monooxygenase SsuD/methylene tetrahydromethanopterin reductase-like flavin-dependent oxidoreductase (luciferase family)